MPSKIDKSFTYEGKRYYVGGNTEREVYEKMALKKKELAEGKALSAGNPFFRDWVELCMETYVRPSVKDITYKKYYDRVDRHIVRELGDYQIKNIKSYQVQKALNKLTGKSKYLIKDTERFLKMFFKYAIKEKLINENPALDLIRPSGTKTTRRALTDKEQEIFLDIVNNKAYKGRFNVFALMYYCGCRPSEAKNCRKADISELNGYKVLHIRGTKTANADRIVPIPSELYDIIKDSKDYLATNEQGNQLAEQSYRRAWERLQREMNIKMGCKVYRNALIPPLPLAEDLMPYCFRHTYCTNLQKQGIDVRVAQYLMGHSDIRLTANIYTHADESFVMEAAFLMQKDSKRDNSRDNT